MAFFEKIWEDNPHYLMLGGLLIVITFIGKAKLFAKANQPWIAAFVPIWDIAVTLRMVGRPVSHMAFFLVPVYNLYFGFKLLIEIAQSFGKRSVVDYIMVCIFNLFYVLNLALAYNEEYEGPVYGKELKGDRASEPALA
jgi:signal peptidase I